MIRLVVLPLIVLFLSMMSVGISVASPGDCHAPALEAAHLSAPGLIDASGAVLHCCQGDLHMALPRDVPLFNSQLANELGVWTPATFYLRRAAGLERPPRSLL
jgi:hypothetical protein